MLLIKKSLSLTKGINYVESIKKKKKKKKKKNLTSAGWNNVVKWRKITAAGWDFKTRGIDLSLEIITKYTCITEKIELFLLL